MRALLAAVLLLLPSSLFAATITFEQPFSLVADRHFPAQNDSFDPGFIDRHYFGTERLWWEVPAFDHSLGTLLVLFARIEGVLDVDFTTTPAFSGIRPLAMLTPGGSRLAFVQEGVIELESHIGPESLPHLIPIGLDPGDTFFSYPIAFEGHVHVEFSGVASGTYLYDPIVTEVPEPLSLVLVGSGFAAGYHRRRRRRRHSERTLRKSA